ncbi:hypothetical protein [Ferrimonas marina]|uniref:Uncharacterized protein n=1 Tax=Ferrimonas marina TaxID=299255 RepID=A0A1M5ULP3_9GAMM|nr:hypothetical protein [Ferrimonas marina]SHH63881.1 hypothetical protein SAMN02745129_2628 [Ferrimonas marina]
MASDLLQAFVDQTNKDSALLFEDSGYEFQLGDYTYTKKENDIIAIFPDGPAADEAFRKYQASAAPLCHEDASVEYASAMFTLDEDGDASLTSITPTMVKAPHPDWPNHKIVIYNPEGVQLTGVALAQQLAAFNVVLSTEMFEDLREHISTRHQKQYRHPPGTLKILEQARNTLTANSYLNDHCARLNSFRIGLSSIKEIADAIKSLAISEPTKADLLRRGVQQFHKNQQSVERAH